MIAWDPVSTPTARDVFEAEGPVRCWLVDSDGLPVTRARLVAADGNVTFGPADVPESLRDHRGRVCADGLVLAAKAAVFPFPFPFRFPREVWFGGTDCVQIDLMKLAD